MKVLLLNRAEDSHRGGDAIHLRAYQRALKELGHIADYKPELNPDANGYDVAVLWHLNFGWTRYQWNAINRSHTPYYVVAIYYPGIYSDTDHETMQKIVDGAIRVITLSPKEDEELKKEFPNARTQILSNGVAKSIFNPSGPRFDRLPFIMSAGRYTSSKGLMVVSHIAKQLGLPVVIAGMTWDPDYMDAILKDNPRAELLLNLNQEELAKYYRSCGLYVCASLDDRDNLTVLEAAACGVPVIDSVYNRGSSRGWFVTVDPKDEKALMDNIQDMFGKKDDHSNLVPDWKVIVQQMLN